MIYQPPFNLTPVRGESAMSSRTPVRLKASSSHVALGDFPRTATQLNAQLMVASQVADRDVHSSNNLLTDSLRWIRLIPSPSSFETVRTRIFGIVCSGLSGIVSVTATLV